MKCIFKFDTLEILDVEAYTDLTSILIQDLSKLYIDIVYFITFRCINNILESLQMLPDLSLSLNAFLRTRHALNNIPDEKMNSVVRNSSCGKKDVFEVGVSSSLIIWYTLLRDTYNSTKIAF